MKLNFRARILATIAIACVICTTAAVLVARGRIAQNGEHSLLEKSKAILSRLEVGRDYVAEMDILDGVVAETVRKFPDGKLTDEQKVKVLKSVPIFAAMQLGAKGAAAENYSFRIASKTPRRKDNQATADEAKVIERFEADKSLPEFTEKSADGKFLIVSRPIRISQKQGCLTCHGHPSTSPYHNGKDVLGYPMEDLHDGDIRGTFSIVSSLAPVQEVTRASTNNIIIWGCILTVVALILGFYMIRGPLDRLNKVSANMASAGTELSSASSQISSVSQNLSSNSTEAAASLEETVSSVEELSSMVQRNAESAKEAASLSRTSRDSAERGEKEIQELIGAISEISRSSKKIEEIISVIDDIAFQTNLLALNAAVEAARAGEQGKGFAVVAEAVRNLAQRSANAAKDISNLIRESVTKVERGSHVAGNSGAALNEIVVAVKKVADLNNEIATASSEQANGIAQISKAMNQLDQTTQQNAAASEESAASAEELSSQASALQDLVQELTAVIVGRASAQGGPGNYGSGERKEVQESPSISPKGTAHAEEMLPFGDAEERKSA